MIVRIKQPNDKEYQDMSPDTYLKWSDYRCNKIIFSKEKSEVYMLWGVLLVNTNDIIEVSD